MNPSGLEEALRLIAQEGDVHFDKFATDYQAQIEKARFLTFQAIGGQPGGLFLFSRRLLSVSLSAPAPPAPLFGKRLEKGKLGA